MLMFSHCPQRKLLMIAGLELFSVFNL